MLVILKSLYHRGQECIGVYFEKNAVIQKAIQKGAAARWSKTKSCWYVPCTGENYLHLKTALENKAELEIGELKKFLLEKRKGNAESSLAGNHKIIATEKNPVKVANLQKVGNLQKPAATQNKLSKENGEAMQQFKRHLVLKAYSQSTIRTYTNEFSQFLNTIKKKPAKEFTVSRLKDYFQYCFTTLHLSENTLHSRINAMKFYYEQVLGREKFFWVYPVGLKKY